MPKAFSEEEREYIKKRLMEEAQVCLTQFGMRKTSVDELVKRVGIPKGTFYLFYSSKELLFFEVFNTLQDQIQKDMLQRLNRLGSNINADAITDVIFQLYKQVDSTFIYSFLSSGELELLVRKLPPEIVNAHVQKDDFNMEQLLGLIPGRHTQSTIKIFSAALRAIFCSMSHKKEIGEDIFDETIQVMLRGVINQVFEGRTL